MVENQAIFLFSLSRFSCLFCLSINVAAGYFAFFASLSMVKSWSCLMPNFLNTNLSLTEKYCSLSLTTSTLPCIFLVVQKSFILHALHILYILHYIYFQTTLELPTMSCDLWNGYQARLAPCSTLRWSRYSHRNKDWRLCGPFVSTPKSQLFASISV